MHNDSLSKILENSVHDISSCRKPRNAILSRTVDLNALYQHPIPPRHFRFRFCRYGRQRFFDLKYLASPWEFHKKISLLYTSP